MPGSDPWRLTRRFQQFLWVWNCKEESSRISSSLSRNLKFRTCSSTLTWSLPDPQNADFRENVLNRAFVVSTTDRHHLVRFCCVWSRLMGKHKYTPWLLSCPNYSRLTDSWCSVQYALPYSMEKLTANWRQLNRSWHVRSLNGIQGNWVSSTRSSVEPHADEWCTRCMWLLLFALFVHCRWSGATLSAGSYLYHTETHAHTQTWTQSIHEMSAARWGLAKVV